MSRDRVCETAGCPSVSIRAYWVAEVPWSLPRFLGTVRLITTLAVVAAIGALAVGTTSPLLNPYQYDAAAKHQLAGIAAPAHNAMVPLFPRPASIAPTPPFLAAEGVPDVAAATKLYHYTSADPASVFERGLLPGKSGNVYLTPDGELSPIQAHIDLGLSPGRGFPQHLFEVDAQGLAEHLGQDLPNPSRVTGWPGGGAGGGWEVPINAPIPPWLLRLVR